MGPSVDGQIVWTPSHKPCKQTLETSGLLWKNKIVTLFRASSCLNIKEIKCSVCPISFPTWQFKNKYNPHALKVVYNYNSCLFFSFVERAGSDKTRSIGGWGRIRSLWNTMQGLFASKTQKQASRNPLLHKDRRKRPKIKNPWAILNRGFDSTVADLHY